MRFAVIQFGGSNCDRDTHYVLSDLLNIETDLIWYKERLNRDYDAIILPGGFSYGDYLRAGAIAARTPIMNDIIDHAKKGKLVLGICNGAQICAESGLVPGTFTTNISNLFICKRVSLKVKNNKSPFTKNFNAGEVISLPIAHKEGRFLVDEVKGSGFSEKENVVFTFCDENGDNGNSSNPNGSLHGITGVLSDS